MDTQLIVWVLIFVGGYSAVVAYLLWIALASRGRRGPGSPSE